MQGQDTKSVELITILKGGHAIVESYFSEFNNTPFELTIRASEESEKAEKIISDLVA